MLEGKGEQMRPQPQIDPTERKEFHKDLAALYAAIKPMTKDEKNPFFKSAYVPLPKLLMYLRPLCEAYGFILEQPVEVGHTQAGIVNVVTTRIIHIATGLSAASQLSIPAIDDMQKLGGAITYSRRYTATALFGLPEVDDDGNTASGKAAPKKGKISSNDDF
jgi:hypothetical protein